MTEYEDDYEQEEEVDVSAMLIKRDEIASVILAKRDEAVRARAASGIERRWRDDEIMHDGYDQNQRRADMVDYASGDASVRDLKTINRSRVNVNIVRGRCEVAVGRFCDIVLPTDDRNWGLKVTPIPEMEELATDKREAFQNGEPIKKGDGETATVGDVAKDKMRIAKEKMKKMQTVIDDQTTECDFNAELRKCIQNAVRLGTGIMKGPNVLKKVDKKWMRGKDGVFALSIDEEKFAPFSVSVDPWSVFPDPQCNDDIRNAAYVWERDLVLPKDLAKLIGVDGYDSDMIREVLNEDPKRVDTIYNKQTEKFRTYDQVVQKGSAYERWEYYGEVDKDSLQSLGCDCESTGMVAATLSACVVFVNDRPIKAVLNTLDTGDLPYDFFKWATVSNTPWGIGVPRQMHDLQRVITGAWQKMMDNAGDSSGANYVFAPGMEPIDGTWELTGKKGWRYTGTGDMDVRKLFGQFQVQSNQGDLQSIIDMALKFSDLETGLPTIFQGEAQKAPETLGATNIMVDSANIGVRQRVKLFDDHIIDPHITRYYDWNMQYNEDEDIKGDYQVDARGTGVLLERDTQAQTLLSLFQLKGDPDVNLRVDWDRVVKQLVAIERADVLKTDEEYEEAKQAQQQGQQEVPPQVQAAQIRVQADLQKAQLDAQSKIQEEELRLQRQREDNEFKAQEGALERQHKEGLAMLQKDIAMMELAESSKLSLEEIKASLAETSAKLNTQKEIAFNNGSGPQVIKPAVEPPGRAPNGEAFQR